MTGNVASAVDPVGQAVAFDSALLVNDSPLTMRDAVISGNRVTQDSATTADVGFGGTAVELDGGGTISDTQITHNSSEIKSDDAVAGVGGALGAFDFSGDPKPVSVRDTVIKDTTATASSPSGTATVQGAGITNDTILELRAVEVRDNVGVATAPHGFAQGGGVFNSDVFGTPPQLTLIDSVVRGNILHASNGLEVHGGGLFTTFPVTVTRTRIARNEPDQCAGC